MTRLLVPEDPGGYRTAEDSAIRSPAVAAGLPLPAAARLNWLISHGASLVFEQWWPAVSSLSSRIYHRRSVNARRLFVVALIERATAAPGTLTITPSGGAAATLSTDDVASASAWGDPGWQCWYADLPLVAAGLQYHTLVTSQLLVRYLGVWELTRGELDTASDTMVELASGSYAGLEAGRWICDGAVGSVQDILAAVASAEDATKRHGGGVIFPDSTPWSKTGLVEGNIADPTLTTSGFYFPFRARRIRSATTYVSYEVRIRARCDTEGGPNGTFRLSSSGTLDSVVFTKIPSAWSWLSPDGGATLDVDADADDHLTPTGYTDDAGAAVQVSSIQWLE